MQFSHVRLMAAPGRLFPLALGMISTLFFAGCETLKPVKPVKVAPVQPVEDATSLQIFLDAESFGPGVIDSGRGEFTKKALECYNLAHGLPPGSDPDLSAIQPLAIYTVVAEDLSVLGTMATEPVDIAKQKRLPYTTLAELIAERFHTTVNYLKKLNPGRDINLLVAGDSLNVPNVARPFYADRFPSTYPAPSARVAKARRVLVDLSARMLEVYEGDVLLAAFPITPGSAEHPAPVGEWKIMGAVPWPWYRYDEGVLKRGERTENFFNFPPGVNSPVGVLWAGTDRPGVGIHGTPNPDTIGRAGSHGCIRLANWDAATFYTLIGKGTPVTIR